MSEVIFQLLTIATAKSTKNTQDKKIKKKEIAQSSRTRFQCVLIVRELINASTVTKRSWYTQMQLQSILSFFSKSKISTPCMIDST